MVVFRFTRRLVARMGVSPASNGGRSTTRLGDWYGTVVVARPALLVIAIGERTLLPVVIAAAPFATLPARVGPAVGGVLRALGIPERLVVNETERMAENILGRASDHRILGSLNEFVRIFPDELAAGRSLIEASLRLAEAPCGPLGMDSPREATRALFLGG